MRSTLRAPSELQYPMYTLEADAQGFWVGSVLKRPPICIVSGHPMEEVSQALCIMRVAHVWLSKHQKPGRGRGGGG